MRSDGSLDDRVLVIPSGGCNALDYLLEQPAHVYAVDVNHQQNALLALKIAGIRSLDWEDFFSIFGVGRHPRIDDIYERHSGSRDRGLANWRPNGRLFVRDQRPMHGCSGGAWGCKLISSTTSSFAITVATQGSVICSRTTRLRHVASVPWSG